MTEPQAITSDAPITTPQATAQTEIPACPTMVTAKPTQAEILAHPTRKVFHLNDILCLTTGLMLAREGAAALHRLVAFITEEDASARNTAINGHAAQQCVLEQLAFLSEINTASLYSVYQYKSSRNNPYLDIWLDMMALRYGAEHMLVTRAKWQAQKNSHKLPPPKCANLPANAGHVYAPA